MEKISIRKYRNSDLKNRFNLFYNKEIIQNLNIELKIKDISLKQQKKWIEETIKSYKINRPKNYNLAITLNDEFIGGIGINNPDYINKKVGIGYWIGQPYRGRGHAVIALKQFTNLLHKRFKFKRIEAITFSYNKASQKVLKKAGFKYEGEKKKSVKRGKEFLDEQIFALIK